MAPEHLSRGAHRIERAALHLLTVLFIASAPGCALPRIPVDDVVTSPFGMRWSGVLPEVHRGVDLRAREGTPVRSMAPGRVRYAGWMNGYGNVVWIDHRSDVISVYGHLSEIQVTPGAPVEGGEMVGLSGSTGNVSGPHLHFEVWVRGRQVDPLAYLGRSP